MITKNDLRFFLDNFISLNFDNIVACEDPDDTVTLVEDYLEMLEEEGEVAPEDTIEEDDE